jgi:hypothetical protein
VQNFTALAKATEVIKREADSLQHAGIARHTDIGVAFVCRVLADPKTAVGGRKAAPLT